MPNSLQKVSGTFKKLGVVVGTGLLSVAASADPIAINTADAVAQIGEANTSVAAVGSALLVLAAIALAFRWTKATFF